MGRDFSHNCILIRELRRLEIRSMFPPKSPFRALFGAFYPHPAHRSALRAEGLRTSWHLVNVGAPPSPWPLFSRLPPHTAVRRHQRGQVMSRPFPAGYCLMPTPELGKSQRGPISTSDPSTLSMSPNQVIFTDKTICSPPLAAAHPLTVLSWPRRSTPVLPRGHEVGRVGLFNPWISRSAESRQSSRSFSP